MISRCQDLQFKKGHKATLIKMKKTHQNNKIDLPALGIETIRNLAKYGFAGVAVQADYCLIINQKEVIKLADELGLFIIGV